MLGLALVLLAAALPAPASASAPTPSYAETRVRGFEVQNPAGIGAERAVSPTGTEGYAAQYDELAVGYPLVPRGTGWVLPEAGGGARIGGRWYTEHALERMAPRTPEVMAELESRALARARAAGLEPGTPEFGKWWGKYGPDPRNVPPSVIETEIAAPGSTGVRVITNAQGDVVTVIPGGG